MNGIGASPGIAISKALIFEHEDIVIDTSKIQNTQYELNRFSEALNSSKKQLLTIKSNSSNNIGKNQSRILDAQLLMLEDPEFIGLMKGKIISDRITADNAVKQTTDYYAKLFNGMENEYLRERASDIGDVGNRIIFNLLGVKSWDLSIIEDDVIIIAHDILPSNIALFNRLKVRGFATDIGSKTSHSSIMARSLGIPAVMGLGNITKEIKNGDVIIVDGIEGDIVINPSFDVIKKYRKKERNYYHHRKELYKNINYSSITKDGYRVELSGNISYPDDIENVLKNSGQGIGLYRTEFLYINSNGMPSEEEQFEVYKKVFENMKGKPVFIRTLDIGGDKKLPYLELNEEINPILGLRAIRFCLQNKELFRVQLRAILRASVYGVAYITFPMISNVEEVKQAKMILNECKKELDNRGIAYDKDIMIGIMVEIPAAAISADIIAKEVDFFSIGTNDLCQYTLGVDRMNEKVSYLYEPLNPSILRLIKNVIDVSQKEGIFTCMCGEMAGDPYATLILLGLGLDRFSMSAYSIPEIKNIIRKVSKKKAEEIASNALKLSTSSEIKQLVKKELNNLDIKLIK